MIAVIFEAFPLENKWDEYFDIAANLLPALNKIDGFISIERFKSVTDPTKVLSLSFWKDEESIAQWRNVELHRKAQTHGRSSIFDNYRIRVAAVQRDYSIIDRAEAPCDSKSIHK